VFPDGQPAEQGCNSSSLVARLKVQRSPRFCATGSSRLRLAGVSGLTRDGLCIPPVIDELPEGDREVFDLVPPRGAP
jgi:hypothetical protein